MKKFFITIEGCDGAGKSTVVNAIYEHLTLKKLEVIKTREPGGNNVAEKFRDIIVNHHITPMTEALTFAAARLEHIEHVIKPAFEKNQIVICDRYFDSSIVYQGYARKLGVEEIKLINKYAVENFKPDLTIVLDVDIETAQKRIQENSREANRLDNEKKEFHQKCREGFNKLNEIFPYRNIQIVDASKSKKEVKQAVIKLIDEALKND